MTRSPRQSVVIFHGIGPPARTLEDGEAAYWLPRDSFRAILDRIAALGATAPLVTFDDGNASDIEIALPELQARGLSAVFFLLAGRLGQPGSLTDTDVTALARAGQQIGLHGQDHVDWRRLDAAGRIREFRDARDHLAALSGQPVDLAAAPFGRYDRRVTEALCREGFRHLHTSDRGRARPDRFLQPRNCLEASMTWPQVEAALAGRLPALRRPRRWLGLSSRRLLPLGAMQ